MEKVLELSYSLYFRVKKLMAGFFIWFWRFWYDYANMKYQRLTSTIAFLNFGYSTDATLLNADIDEKLEKKMKQLRQSLPKDQFPLWCSVQLYSAVLACYEGELDGKKILEVGCGRGGGASVVHAWTKPGYYTGIDLSPEGVSHSRELFKGRVNAEFQVGNSMDLGASVAKESMDVVLNVESSHCYPDFDKFAAGVAYSLKKGEWNNIRRSLERHGLRIRKDNNITQNVLKSMKDEVSPALHKMNMDAASNIFEKAMMWLVSRQTVRAPMSMMQNRSSEYRLIAAVKE